jgi:YtkA-like
MRQERKLIAQRKIDRCAGIPCLGTQGEASKSQWRGCRVVAPARPVMLLLLAIATLSLCACRRSADSARGISQGISIEESIAPQPPRSGDETVFLNLADAAGHPLSRARVQIEADMNHPGMAPAFSDAVETAPGRYRASLTFTMGGNWVVLAHITLADGRRIERQWDVKGVESR